MKKWMRLALIEASIGESEGEVPVGAILINNAKLLAKAHNQPIIKHDPTAHAEIQVIRAAGQYLQNYRLPHSTLLCNFRALYNVFWCNSTRSH